MEVISIWCSISRDQYLKKYIYISVIVKGGAKNWFSYPLDAIDFLINLPSFLYLSFNIPKTTITFSKLLVLLSGNSLLTWWENKRNLALSQNVFHYFGRPFCWRAYALNIQHSFTVRKRSYIRKIIFNNLLGFLDDVESKNHWSELQEYHWLDNEWNRTWIQCTTDYFIHNSFIRRICVSN